MGSDCLDPNPNSHLLAVRPQPNVLASVCFHFLICEMRPLWKTSDTRLKMRVLGNQDTLQGRARVRLPRDIQSGMATGYYIVCFRASPPYLSPSPSPMSCVASSLLQPVDSHVKSDFLDHLIPPVFPENHKLHLV